MYLLVNQVIWHHRGWRDTVCQAWHQGLSGSVVSHWPEV